jgi:hypothetical protein
MKKHESATRPNVGDRPRLEESESTYRGHEPIVNVPPARVEPEKPTATLAERHRRETHQHTDEFGSSNCAGK